MLIPSRFSNLRFSLLNTTSLVIECLLKKEIPSVDEILEYLSIFFDGYTRDDVIQSVTFLYALGKVEYSEESDSVFYIKELNKRNLVVA